MTRWLTALLALVVLAALAAAGLLAFLDGERVRNLLHEKLSSEHGVILTIDSLERSYSLRPDVRLRGLTVASAVEPSLALIRIEEASFRIHPLSLLIGPVTLDQVKVDTVRFTVPVNDDGVMYWEPVVDAISDWLHSLDWSLPRFDVSDLALQGRHKERGNELLVSAQQVTGTMPRLEELRLLAQAIELDLETALPLRLKGTASIDKLLLDQSDSELPMTLRAAGSVGEEPLSIEIQGGNLLAGDPLDRKPVHGTVELGDAIATMAGTMSRDDDMHVHLHVEVEKADSDDKGALHGELDVSDPAEGWKFSAIRVTRGGAVVTGDIGIDVRDGRRTFAADLQAANIDLPQMDDDSEAESDQAAGSIVPEGDLLSNLLDFIDRFDASVTLASAESVFYGVPFERLDLKATARNGFIEVAVDETTVLDGTLRASLRVRPVDEQTTLELEATLEDAGLDAFTSRASALEGVSGTFDGDIGLQASGRETDAVLASLSGRTRFELQRGSMPEELATWMAGDIFSALFADFDREDVTPIDCAVVDLEIQSGLGTARAMVLDTGSFTIHGTGEIDFENRKLHFDLVPSAKEFALLSLRLPLQIRGPFDNIDIDADRSEAAISLLSPIGADDEPAAECGGGSRPQSAEARIADPA